MIRFSTLSLSIRRRRQVASLEFDSLLKSRFARQIADMGAWRIVSLGIGFAGSIWAAKCLGPENLGISSMITATVMQIGLLVGLNQDANLIRLFKDAESEERRESLVSAVLTFRLASAAALAVVGLAIVLLVGVKPHWRLGVFAAIPMLLLAFNSSTWLLQAQENMSACYKVQAICSIITSILYLVFFRPGIGPGCDVLVADCSAVATFILSWWYAIGLKMKSALNFKHLRIAIDVYKKGRWLMLTGVVIYIYTQLETPLLGYLSNIKEVGIYRVANVPVSIFSSFSTMIPPLMYPRFIDWRRSGKRYFWNRQVSLARLITLLIVPAACVCFLATPTLFKVVYGPQFRAAALPSAILLTSKLIVILNGIFAWGLWAQGHDKTMLFLMGVTAAMSLGLNCVLIPRFGMLAASVVNLMSEVVIFLGSFFFARKYARL